MALEYQLTQLSKNDTPLDDILDTVKGGIKKNGSAGRSTDLFSWAKITRDGYHALAV